jgi:hypothetical protein
MKYSYILFYSFIEESIGHTRFARGELKLKKAITSDDLLAFESEQVAAGDSRAVVTNYKLLGIMFGVSQAA